MELIDAVKAKSKELQTLRDRRKYDIETLYNNKKYNYSRTDGETQGFESVTIPAARIFADKVIQLLATAQLRYDIRPVDIKKTTRDICSVAEEFLKFARAKADEYNAEYETFPLSDSDNFYSSIEGAVARIVLTLKSGKMFQHTIIPVDPYNVVYDFSADGYRGIYGKLSGDDILKNYNFPISSKDATVADIFTNTDRKVLVDDKPVPGFNYAHKQRKNPFLYVGVPTTPFLTVMSNAVMYQNESIFAGARAADRTNDLFQELNRAYSEWKTQNTLAIRPGYQFIHPDDERPEIEKPVSGADETVATGKGKFELIPLPNFPNAYMANVAQIQQWLQRATMPNVEFGELSLHGLSALALKNLKSSKDQTFIPRLNAKNKVERLTAYRLVEQYVDGGYPTDFDGGYEIPFEVADLKHNFMILVEHFAESPEENLAQLQMAASARAEGLPDEHIYTHQLPVEDIDKLMRQKREQELINENLIARRLSQAKAHTIEFEKTKDEFHELMANIALAEIGYEFKNGKFTEKSTQLPSQPSPSNVLQTPSLGAPRNDNALMQRNEDRQNNMKQSEKAGVVNG